MTLLDRIRAFAAYHAAVAAGRTVSPANAKAVESILLIAIEEHAEMSALQERAKSVAWMKEKWNDCDYDGRSLYEGIERGDHAK